ncbi:MAG: helix-turn-helix transcriptional regulator [Kiritimatiellae bacterium]|jgi:predicted XRE-type DNA-binding protein|nr:helix-turn-helix transcriptional regulator [Kiritimatiellia bacterium]
MDADKRKKLESAGFVVGDTQKFLNLSDEEMAFVEIKRSLSRTFLKTRKSQKLTQIQAAKILGTSQSRVAKMEHADKSVSLDLLTRANLALGVKAKTLQGSFKMAVAEDVGEYKVDGSE